MLATPSGISRFSAPRAPLIAHPPSLTTASLLLVQCAMTCSIMASSLSPSPAAHSTLTGSTATPCSRDGHVRAASLDVVTSTAPSAAANRRSDASCWSRMGAWSGSGSVAQTRQPSDRSARKNRSGRAVPVNATTRRPDSWRAESGSGWIPARRTGRPAGRSRARRSQASGGGPASRLEWASQIGERAMSASARATDRANGSRRGPAGRTRPLPTR
eukprot:scaffold15277_cov129-Isochrysis_galbana.AAC.7